MTGLTDISPRILNERHRLSPRQINSLFGKEIFKETYKERIGEFEVLKEFILITDELNLAGIEFIPLKGPLLSYRLYGDASVRLCRDLDILVDVLSIEKTKAILEKMGYMQDTIRWPDTSFMKSSLIKHFNQLSLRHPEKELVVEVHWRLLANSPVTISYLDSVVRQNQIILKFAGRSFSVLSNEFELLYLIIHGGLHFWMRIKWLLDVNTFISTQKIDWEYFSKLSVDLKATRIVALYQAISSHFFNDGHEIPCHFNKPRKMTRFSYNWIRNENEPFPISMKMNIKYFYFKLIGFTGVRYKVNEITNRLFMSFFSGRIGSLVR